MYIVNTAEAIGFATQWGAHGGYHYTLTTSLGNFLWELQRKFGPRDMTYTPLGIEFAPDGPMIWYPIPESKHLSIVLSDNARRDWKRALWQLAHESVHVLAPTGQRNSLVVEEGLASLYADETSRAYGLGYLNTDPRYQYCIDKVRELLTIQIDAVTVLRRLEPSFSKWQAQWLVDVLPNVPRVLADALCEPFEILGARLGVAAP